MLTSSGAEAIVYFYVVWLGMKMIDYLHAISAQAPRNVSFIATISSITLTWIETPGLNIIYFQVNNIITARTESEFCIKISMLLFIRLH